MNHAEAGKLGAIAARDTIEKEKQKRIEQYNQNPNKCIQCGQPLDYKHRHNKFCNQSCSATYNNYKNYKKTYNGKPVSYRKEIVKNGEIEREVLVRDYGNCVYCGKPLNSHQKKYCSSECETNYKYNQRVERWKSGEDDGIRANGTTTDTIKRYLREKYNNSCAKCGWHEFNEYTGKVPLEVHHINGDWSDNREENLILLCPNCHSLTPTYKACNVGNGRKGRVNKRIDICRDRKLNLVETKHLCKRCGKELTTHGAEYCMDCVKFLQRKVERPTKEELSELIKTKSFLQIGKQYSVSDNTIRKWCKSYGLPYRKIDINNGE